MNLFDYCEGSDTMAYEHDHWFGDMSDDGEHLSYDYAVGRFP